MKYFAVLFLFLMAGAASAQDIVKVAGTIVNDNNLLPVSNANIINLNKVKGAITDEKGYFEIDASVNDTLHISLIGYVTLNVRVTNDWVKNKTTRIQMTEKAIALEEVIIQPYHLTGYLEVDTKLIPMRENYRYSISGLNQGYEAGESSPGAFGKVLGSIFNPADALYNFFGKKPKELKKLREMKKDDNLRNLLETKYDRETICALLGIQKNDIPEILSRCNYSESFVQTANDLQIMDAISACYEEYKILKKH
ncbi:MAG: carboxypeptidase-like regulatory domain-containing protein [Flavobacterium sp.]|nr:MAG: carboxypeptidase-like regulatory domain-containing protein [Flavobacterium sp.]